MAQSSMRLAETIQEYLETMRAAGQSKKTLKGKASALRRFLLVTGDIWPRNLNITHVDKFLRAHSHWEDSTRIQNLGVLGHFQEYCRARGWMRRDNDILFGKRNLKMPRKSRHRIPGLEFEKVLEEAKDPRDRILLALGFYLLVRASELVPIKWRDVNWDDWEITVFRSKTKQYDDLAITTNLMEELERWRTHVCKTTGVFRPDPDWYVVCSYRSHGVRVPGGWDNSGRTLLPEQPLLNPGQPIRKILEGCGHYVRGEVMHMLRRSGARAMRDDLAQNGQGDDATRIIKTQLGHAQMATTEIYVGSEHDRQMRNKALKGRTLYQPPGGEGANVVPLRGKTG